MGVTTDAAAVKRENFFVSYAGPDAAWAEWVTWELEQLGYGVELDRWDWAAGDNAVMRMSQALERCDCVVALFSQAYFDPQRFTTDEWTAVMARRDRQGRLVPLRLEEVTAPAVLRPLIAPSLTGLAAEDARRVLREAVGGPQRPQQAPGFPGALSTSSRPDGEGPRLPGDHRPTLWQVPLRNGAFIGRDHDIDNVRRRLRPGQPVVVRSDVSLGGVGKTQVAIEYAHRYAAQYDLVAWINAENPRLVTTQLTALAAGLGLVHEQGEAGALPALRTHLQQRARWLLVFDNAESIDAVQSSWLPLGSGHVLITSRSRTWPEFTSVTTGLFTRRESVTLLRTRVQNLSETDADQVADKLGDLPLALVQAATVLSAMPVELYLHVLETGAEVLDEGLPSSYSRPLAAAIRVAIEALAENGEALHLLRLCSVLAPESIPMALLSAAPDAVPPLQPVLSSPMRIFQTAQSLGELAGVGQRGVQVHRLVQTLVVSQLDTLSRAELHRQASALLAAWQPGDPASATTWPTWSQLMPHLLAVNPGENENAAVRERACEALLYLLYSGNVSAGFQLAERLHNMWLQRLGPDDPQTLTAAAELAHAYHDLGRDRDALHLVANTLDRRTVVLGDDHPDTLRSANDHAVVQAQLGKVADALKRGEDVLGRRIKVLGPDHPDTLTTRGHLAGMRADGGDHTAAIAAFEQLLTDQLRVLGPDHPDTLTVRSNLAGVRGEAGDHTAAIAAFEQLLTDRLRILGADHPHTFTGRGNLAGWRGEAGDQTAAIAAFEQLLTDRLRVLGPDHPQTLATRGNLAGWRGEAGDQTAAIAAYEQLLTDQLRVLGPDHPQTLTTRGHLAGMRADAGDLTAAVAAFEQLLTDRLRVLGPDHPDTLTTRGNLAGMRGEAGDHTAAIAAYEQLLTDQLRVLGPDHPQTLTTRGNLAGVRGEAGDHTAAIAAYEQLLTDQLRVLGPDHPQTLTTRGALTIALMRRGAIPAARQQATVKYQAERRLYGKSDHRTQKTSELLNKIKMLMGGRAVAPKKSKKKR